MTKTPAKPLATYRVQAPTLPESIGQGEPPTALVIVVGTRRYELPYGTLVKASATCDPEGGVANLSASPPLVRCAIIDEHAGAFVLVAPPPTAALDPDPEPPEEGGDTDSNPA
ncbi:MAG: hypothetical protein LCH53_13610 [Bacteroidetes bacterium]|nr:hypothetical protein [Bacteroidota bacterium]